MDKVKSFHNNFELYYLALTLILEERSNSSRICWTRPCSYHSAYTVWKYEFCNSYNSFLTIHTSDPHIKESTKLKAPAYTFGGRFKDGSGKVAPSPNSYNTTGLTSKGDDSE